MNPRKQWLKRFGIALLVAGLFIAIGYLYYQHRIDNAFHDAEAAMDAMKTEKLTLVYNPEHAVRAIHAAVAGA